MKTSSALEWCFHAAILLEQAPPGQLVTRQAIAQFHDIPDAYLAKHLKAMVGSGVLVAVTGPNGGYRPARPDDQITGLDIFEAVEGRGPAFQCTEIRQQGVGAAQPSECKRPCGVKILILAGEEAMKQRLAETTVAEMVSAIPAGIRQRNRRLLSRSGGH